ncbi:MAG: META domain-containing protein [Pseudomonadota bacterium]
MNFRLLLPPVPSFHRLFTCAVLLVVMMLSACSWHSGSSRVSLRAQQPQSWQGEISCPGCSERWLTVTLFPDGLFRLRETYLLAKVSGEERFHDTGRWSVPLGDSQRVILKGASTRQMRLLPDGDLILLDATGRDIVSIREYQLRRLPKPDLIADPMRLLALYAANDNGAVMTECLTAQVVSIADSPAAAEMKTVVAGVAPERRARGPILAALTARWGDASGKSDSAGRRLIIEKFDRFWPADNCAQGPIAPSQPLAETVWQLVSIKALPVQEAVLGQPPHIRLRKGGRLTGSTGCNRIQGVWQAGTEKLGLSRISSTRASCRDAMTQQEQGLIEALRDARQYRQVGHQLELLQGDQVLARFVATEML